LYDRLEPAGVYLYVALGTDTIRESGRLKDLATGFVQRRLLILPSLLYHLPD
jgi:hypothetical protein